MAVASDRQVAVRWDNRYLRVGQRGWRDWGLAGTLQEKRGMNCIAEGDAVTFVTLPLPGGPSMIRIKGPRMDVPLPTEWGDGAM